MVGKARTNQKAKVLEKEIVFTIFNATDKRAKGVERMRSILSPHMKEVTDLTFNGYTNSVEDEVARRIYNFKTGRLLWGQVAIWLSVLNALEYAANNNVYVLTLEDDAEINDSFIREFRRRVECLPEDFDFYSLFIARDHTDWFYYQKLLETHGALVDPKFIRDDNFYKYNDVIVRTYQRYGGVSMLYSPDGARKILRLLALLWINDQYDDLLYKLSTFGILNGYTSNPELPDLVWIKGGDPSLVQDTTLFGVDR